MLTSSWRPAWTRADHPIVQRHLRKPFTNRYNYAILGAVLSLFILFGGLSLPLLYLLFSLTVLLHISVATADKIQSERESFTWDLLRSAPFTPGEILLSTWASSLFQLNRTWIMWIYRVLQGLLVIGLMVFGVWFGGIPSQHWLIVLLCGTLVIFLQPFADMYFSGMVGLLSAHLLPDRVTAQGVAIGTVVLYWLVWLGMILLMLLSDMERVTGVQVTFVLLMPLILPACIGYAAYRIARKLMF
jgi:hypothetical protein